MERAPGVEPGLSAWKADARPLCHARNRLKLRRPRTFHCTRRFATRRATRAELIQARHPDGLWLFRIFNERFIRSSGPASEKQKARRSLSGPSRISRVVAES